MYKIYTDGNCSGNPGKGGWACVLVRDDEVVQVLTGSQKRSTNNRMELSAMIHALDVWKHCDVTIYTDSKYVVNGANNWAYNWNRNGWWTRAGNRVVNRDLWELVLQGMSKRTGHTQIKWVKRDTHQGNTLADKHARYAYGGCGKPKPHKGKLAHTGNAKNGSKAPSRSSDKQFEEPLWYSHVVSKRLREARAESQERARRERLKKTKSYL